MMSGLSGSDGRANRPKRLAAPKTDVAPSAAAESTGPPPVEVAPPPTAEAETGLPRVARFLAQAVGELERLAETERHEIASYADHLLARLRLLHDGLGSLRWFHDWKVGPGWR